MDSRISDKRSLALQALAGADYVREKIIATLTVGPKDFSRQIYAIKCRVKSEQRLIEKVENRKLKTPNYTALDATDVVGLRLVCIFSEELPRVVSDFLDYVEFMQDPRIALFVGNDPEDAISEVIVYAAMNNSSVYQSIFDNLHKRFSSAIRRGTTKVTLEPPSEQHPYSSIHIICRSVSYYAESPKNVSVEVQIRTVFEDIWSEIEHPRGYKGPNFSEMYSENQTLFDLARNISVRLNNLKGALEVCARQAEDVGRDFNILNKKTGPNEALLNTKQSNRRLVQQQLTSKNAPAIIIDRLDNIEKKFGKIYEEIFDDSPISSIDQVKNVVLRLDLSVKELDKVAVDYELLANSEFVLDSEFTYYRYSETGLAEYWIARLMKGFLEPSSTEAPPDTVRISEIGGASSDRHLDRALKAYFTLQECLGGIDALLSFRIANALWLQDHHTLALEKCKEAYQSLDGDNRLPKGDKFRAVIPRGYAYALWRQALRLRLQAGQGTRARDTVREAINISLYARENYLRNLSQVDQKEENIRYQNNILNFLATFSELNGSLEDMGDLGGRDRMLRDVEDLEKKAGNVASRLDTCVRAYIALGEPQRAEKCARALQTSLERTDLARHYRPEDVAYMRESIRLAEGVNKNGATP